MEAKRTKVEIKYSRTVQLRQYEPLTVGMTTTLENIDGVSEKDYDEEMKSLAGYCDSVVNELLSKTE